MQRRNEWMFSRGELARDGWESVVDDGIPGWRHTGLRVADLGDGDELELPAAGLERLVVPLSGSFTVRHQTSGPTETTLLEGRASVFDGPSDVLYLSTLSSATVSGSGRVAIAEAPAASAHPSRHIPRSDIPVELRGAGRSSRQVHNFGTPAALEADRFIVCEVITPAENWSSFPAHKHDEEIPGHETRLEEIYYFESAVSRGVEAPAEAEPFGLFSTSSSPAGEITIDAAVRTGDIALVPFGYHGPAVAAPGYDLYYLNVMAGPGDERAWLISDHPAHGWIRETWQGQDIDPRLPYTRATPIEGTHS
ncbi:MULTISPECIES: 5-deoxy-glucuronate isomerase [unclassified Rathayibacter]|uniref:5-deoxy-glucuronate isomerase n=1 Tax=unclassified Rathayibacter TaxID=2609250 RepID=UPI0006FE79EF|nr:MULTISPECIES: 5-deoxy-glucuronate isomerase [unclassified Rathayibacter]KQP95944.1 5-deoxy-glucuronate isomerase [Rathayibacter sp. Leaf294]KQS07665.1 5-deoxy-glucuronate isomerase [Rathayibacter sp. Leaf185]